MRGYVVPLKYGIWGIALFFVKLPLKVVYFGTIWHTKRRRHYYSADDVWRSAVSCFRARAAEPVASLGGGGNHPAGDTRMK